MASRKNVNKPALANVGFKLDTTQWEALYATAHAKGQDVATFTREALEAAVKRAGLYVYPEVDPATYKRGRPFVQKASEPAAKKKRVKKAKGE